MLRQFWDHGRGFERTEENHTRKSDGSWNVPATLGPGYLARLTNRRRVIPPAPRRRLNIILRRRFGSDGYGLVGVGFDVKAFELQVFDLAVTVADDVDLNPVFASEVSVQ